MQVSQVETAETTAAVFVQNTTCVVEQNERHAIVNVSFTWGCSSYGRALA